MTNDAPRSPGWIALGLRAAVACATMTSACSSSSDNGTCTPDTGPLVTLRGKAVDGRTGAPVADAHVVVEVCGLYTKNPDPSKAQPNYRYGVATAADGTFAAQVPRGAAGLHVFHDGYSYGPAAVGNTDSSNNVVQIEPLLPADIKPTVKDFSVTPTTASPGADLTFSAGVFAASPSQPLSEEVLLVQAETDFARALNPPSPGNPGQGFPDGTWRGVFKAPTSPGTYVYALDATTEGCINADRATVKVTVQ